MYKLLYVEFTKSLDAKNVERWLKELAAFEKDPTQPDPYFVVSAGTVNPIIRRQNLISTFTGLSEAEIRAQLAAEDDQESSNDRGGSGRGPRRLSPAGMIIEMLEIEDQQ